MARVILTSDDNETQAYAAEVALSIKPGAIVALRGPLGAGKTVFVRGLAAGLGICSPITSPSFTIVSEYDTPVSLVHIDLYRTESDEELELLGLSELISRNAVVAIEWAEKAKEFLPDRYIDVEIRVVENGREIHIDGLDEDEQTDELKSSRLDL